MPTELHTCFPQQATQFRSLEIQSLTATVTRLELPIKSSEPFWGLKLAKLAQYARVQGFCVHPFFC